MNMKKILEMKAKREDARLKAMAVLNKAEAEDRFLSEEEQKDIDKYEEEIRAWDESIGRAEKLLAIEPEDRSSEKPEGESRADCKRLSSRSPSEPPVALTSSLCKHKTWCSESQIILQAPCMPLYSGQ